MSVDDRLRTGLRLDHEYSPKPSDELIRLLLARVKRRRRVRRVGIGAAVAGLVISIAVPLVSGSRSLEPPVDQTPATRHTAPLETWKPITSPVDGKTWAARVLTPQQRLATLEGTGLEHRATAVFARARMKGRMSALVLWQGQFAAFSNDLTHHLVRSPGIAGSFHLAGRMLVVNLADAPGRTKLRWRKPDDDHLVLHFVSSTVSSLYGAPAEVFFRLWSATPFTLRLGY